jgi:EAL domain-containing protein (putative c-di-GMP-specific phosphodiesterase class I)
MEIIAEGAETLAQVEFLRKHHCDEIQGFYYSAPVPYQQFQSLVVKQYDQRSGFSH